MNSEIGLVTCFCMCNSVRIGQNIQNEVLQKRSIFADVVAFQFLNLNGKLNGSRKEDIHRSIWNENDSSRRRVKRCLGLNTHLQRLVQLSVVFFLLLLLFFLFFLYYCFFVCFYINIFFRMTRTVLTCNGY